MSSLDPPVPARMSRVGDRRSRAVACATPSQPWPTPASSSSWERCLPRRGRSSRRCAASSARPPRTTGPVPRLAPQAVDPGELERLGRHDLLAGEVELVRRGDAAVRHGRFAALVGWAPQSELAGLEERLAACGAGLVELPRPAWVEPPTLLPERRGVRSFRPLVDTYGALRYADVDPTPFAAFSFVVMFGMMFGDVGQGLLLAGLGAALSQARHGRFAPFRHLWPFPVAAGLAAAFFGLLYGEFFGPTGVVPTIWVKPTEDPIVLLAAAVAVGGVLLAVSYGIGIVNRWREGGPAAALTAPSGIAGFLIFLGLGLAAWGWYVDSSASRRRRRRARARRRAPPGSRLPCRGRPRGGGGDPGDDRGRRLAHPRRRERHLVRPPGGLRAHARRARRGRLGRDDGAVGRRRRLGARDRRLRRRQRADVRARGPGRGRPGAPPRVLRALLAHLRGRGAALHALAHPVGHRMEAAWKP